MGKRDDETQDQNFDNRTLTSLSNTITKEGTGAPKRKLRTPTEGSKSNSKSRNAKQEDEEEEKENHLKQERNIIIFTGRAFQEITRDMTMQKAFMTLAYISDMMVGSEVSPI